MSTVRVALCQLECHPAIYASHLAYLMEPFVPSGNESSLSQLGTKGFDVLDLQKYCLDKYLSWHEARLRSVLDFLAHFDSVPDIVLFPECSMPVECLSSAGAWSSGTGATILAGTHSLQSDPSSGRRYADMGID